MSFVTNNPGNIMASRAARNLLDDIQKRMSARMAEMESRDYLALLHKIRDELVREENVDTWIAGEFTSLSNRLAAARLTDELGPLYERLTELAARHFQARSSVSTLHEFSGSAIEILLSTSMTIAAELLRHEGHCQPDCAWTLLASDALGRREATRKGHLAIVFIHDDDGTAGSEEYFHLLALRLMAILSQCGILLQIGPLRNGHVFWHGPLDQWRQLMLESSGHQGSDSSGSPQSERYARAIELMADLRPLCGDTSLAERATETTGAILAWERDREPFRQLARRVATMPVALGIFGRFRTARSGKHRGEFSLEEMATRPLVASVRIMAIA
ncbi:MAG TPA: putative nucleotidyltransferase substrate binding domain-containing protein, partial [Geobacteraceae bacterium]|nr:putative nucleotidyltransferase substrate binding domain-containing protein [Geobacteraceae bacterium]